MSIETVSPVAYYGERTGTEARVPQRTLGQDDFLKLLVAQMTQQDPLNPKADIDFIGQMAQFSSLEQARSLQNGMSVLQANALLGRTVSLEDDGLLVVGVVDSVHMKEGTPQLIVGGQSYTLAQVREIAETPTSPAGTGVAPDAA
ncbi:MAG TPA: flagellar hook capping FlgD N-terminal domain-containing protein [Methylomirabilota bacterium]|nr:flagellar hook capping FlgD N-terminal domain-containing protein [Methylomirabilota bacterium]